MIEFFIFWIISASMMLVFTKYCLKESLNLFNLSSTLVGTAIGTLIGIHIKLTFK